MKLNQKVLLVFFIILSIGVIGCSKKVDDEISKVEFGKLAQKSEEQDLDVYEEVNQEDHIDESEIIADLKAKEANIDNKENSNESSKKEYLENDKKYKEENYEDNNEEEYIDDPKEEVTDNNISHKIKRLKNVYYYTEENKSESIGKQVYVAEGNSYYHAIPNCQYLEGAETKLVTLTNDTDKYECNCCTNPVEYDPSSKTSYDKNAENSEPTKGRIVYITDGNSYYHSSPSCKFLGGSHARAVGINEVGEKYPCNCVEY